MNLFINSISREEAMHNERCNALCMQSYSNGPRLKTNLSAYHFNHMLCGFGNETRSCTDLDSS